MVQQIIPITGKYYYEIHNKLRQPNKISNSSNVNNNQYKNKKIRAKNVEIQANNIS